MNLLHQWLLLITFFSALGCTGGNSFLGIESQRASEPKEDAPHNRVSDDPEHLPGYGLICGLVQNPASTAMEARVGCLVADHKTQAPIDSSSAEWTHSVSQPIPTSSTISDEAAGAYPPWQHVYRFSAGSLDELLSLSTVAILSVSFTTSDGAERVVSDSLVQVLSRSYGRPIGDDGFYQPICTSPHPITGCNGSINGVGGEGIGGQASGPNSIPGEGIDGQPGAPGSTNP